MWDKTKVTKAVGVAKLGPPVEATRLADLPRLLRSIPRLSPEEATDFAADIEAARHELTFDL